MMSVMISCSPSRIALIALAFTATVFGSVASASLAVPRMPDFAFSDTSTGATQTHAQEIGHPPHLSDEDSQESADGVDLLDGLLSGSAPSSTSGFGGVGSTIDCPLSKDEWQPDDSPSIRLFNIYKLFLPSPPVDELIDPPQSRLCV